MSPPPPSPRHTHTHTHSAHANTHSGPYYISLCSDPPQLLTHNWCFRPTPGQIQKPQGCGQVQRVVHLVLCDGRGMRFMLLHDPLPPPTPPLPKRKKNTNAHTHTHEHSHTLVLSFGSTSALSPNACILFNLSNPLPPMQKPQGCGQVQRVVHLFLCDGRGDAFHAPPRPPRKR